MFYKSVFSDILKINKIFIYVKTTLIKDSMIWNLLSDPKDSKMHRTKTEK